MSMRYLPFADAASDELPLGRLLRLALFQVSVGMAMVLTTGILNRVMIVEMGVASWLVALMVALPLAVAPFRALVGFRSDTHKSAFGWRRVPYIWFGSMFQFGGLAIMPFALIILSGDTHGPAWLGHVSAALAFLLTGAGLHTTQTAGLALATDLAPPERRSRVVALLYLTLLVGMVGSALVFSALLKDFSQLRLIQVIQGAALVTIVINSIALWKQEGRRPQRDPEAPVDFRQAWTQFAAQPGTRRFLVAVALGTAAFSMQDVLLEPFGAQVLGMTVGATTLLTALFAAGSVVAFAMAARWLGRNRDPHRLAALGLLTGIAAFSAIVFAAPLELPLLFWGGTAFIGVGAGLFSVSMLVIAMGLDHRDCAGMVIGAWGAVQAVAMGIGVALGGTIRDLVSKLATSGLLGEAMNDVSAGYIVVYHLEIALLFATLIAIGPLVRSLNTQQDSRRQFGLAGLPG
ncbi:MAG: BCD family MFS transporter [Xanthomonadales bacterium]|nr:BCD family MFS transporter [Xanthomonadales bacterium]